MLAENAFVLTILVLLLLGGAFYWFVGRRVGAYASRVCDQIDEDHEAQEKRRRLEQEEEARARAKAEQEVDSQFPHLKEQPEDKQNIDENH